MNNWAAIKACAGVLLAGTFLAPVVATAAPAPCSPLTLAGRWLLQTVETNYVWPPEGGSYEETTHGDCTLTVPRSCATRIRVTLRCTAVGPYWPADRTSNAPQSMEINHYPFHQECQWSLDDAITSTEITDGAELVLEFDRQGQTVIGRGALPLGTVSRGDPGDQTKQQHDDRIWPQTLSCGQ